MNTDRTRLLGSAPQIPDVLNGPGVPGLVSVLIPTYNRAYILAKAIDSVLTQTYKSIEIVVVDDGSTDGTRELIERYSDKVRYIYQPNAGLAAARNVGLKAARGEYIAFQDSDDEWTPWKLEAQIAVMRHQPQLAMIWTDMVAVSPDGKVVRDSHLTTMYSAYQEIDINNCMPHSGAIGELLPDAPVEIAKSRYRYGDIYSAMFMGNLVHPPVALMRRENIARIGGLDQTFAWSCEDYEFFWRLSQTGLAALIEAPGMRYRIDAEDQLTKPNLHLYIARGNLEALKRRLTSTDRRIDLPQQAIRSHLAEAHAWVAEEELHSPNGRRTRAIQHSIRALRVNPGQSHAVTLLLISLFVPHWAIPKLRFIKRLCIAIAILFTGEMDAG